MFDIMLIYGLKVTLHQSIFWGQVYLYLTRCVNKCIWPDEDLGTGGKQVLCFCVNAKSTI